MNTTSSTVRKIVLIGSNPNINSALEQLLPSDYTLINYLTDGLDELWQDSEFSEHVSSAVAVMLELSNYERGGLEFLSEFKRRFPSKPVVVFHDYIEKSYAREILKRGAMAYLPVNTFSEELDEALLTILANCIYVSGQVY